VFWSAELPDWLVAAEPVAFGSVALVPEVLWSAVLPAPGVVVALELLPIEPAAAPL
jgi:hypothetical protein